MDNMSTIKINNIIKKYPTVNYNIIYVFFKTYNETSDVLIRMFKFIEREGYNINDFSPEFFVECKRKIDVRKELLKKNNKHPSIITEDLYQIFFGKEIGSEIWNNKRKSKSEKSIEWGKNNPDHYSYAANVKKEMGKTGKEYSVRCKEYWMRIGYTEEDSIKEVTKIQSRGLLFFKNKYENYQEVFNDRNEKWQNTLKNKTDEEIKIINTKKATFSYNECIKRGMDHDTAKDYILNKTNTKKIYFSEQELIDAINKWIDEKSYRKYYPINKIESAFSGVNCFAGWDKPINYNEWILKYINIKDHSNVYRANNKYHTYCMYTENGAHLKSLNEIIFYNILIDNNFIENYDFTIGKNYDNSSYMYDFKIYNTYIELAGLRDKKYMEKMDYKAKTFNTVILYDVSEYEDFIKLHIKNQD